MRHIIPIILLVMAMITLYFILSGCQNVKHFTKVDAEQKVTDMSISVGIQVVDPVDIPILAENEYNKLTGAEKEMMNWYYGNREVVITIVMVKAQVEYVKLKTIP